MRSWRNDVRVRYCSRLWIVDGVMARDAVGHPGTQAAGRVEGDHLLLHRLGHPGGGLAGGGGERHLERGAALVGYLEGGGQDPGDGVRLARTGTSGDHRQRTGEGALRRHELEVDRTVLVERHAAEHFGKAPSDDRGLTRVGRANDGAPVGPPTHVAGDGHLEAPESLQVDAIAVEHERPERVVPVRGRARPASVTTEDPASRARQAPGSGRPRPDARPASTWAATSWSWAAARSRQTWPRRVALAASARASRTAASGRSGARRSTADTRCTSRSPSTPASTQGASTASAASVDHPAGRPATTVIAPLRSVRRRGPHWPRPGGPGRTPR